LKIEFPYLNTMLRLSLTH